MFVRVSLKVVIKTTHTQCWRYAGRCSSFEARTVLIYLFISNPVMMHGNYSTVTVIKKQTVWCYPWLISKVHSALTAVQQNYSHINNAKYYT